MTKFPRKCSGKTKNFAKSRNSTSPFQKIFTFPGEFQKFQLLSPIRGSDNPDFELPILLSRERWPAFLHDGVLNFFEWEKFFKFWAVLILRVLQKRALCTRIKNENNGNFLA